MPVTVLRQKRAESLADYDSTLAAAIAAGE
jgi:hypothetical protein